MLQQKGRPNPNPNPNPDPDPNPNPNPNQVIMLQEKVANVAHGWCAEPYAEPEPEPWP